MYGCLNSFSVKVNYWPIIDSTLKISIFQFLGKLLKEDRCFFLKKISNTNLEKKGKEIKHISHMLLEL